MYKLFGEKHILRGVSFKIRRGEAIGIIDPSSTGKITIVKIIAVFLAPDKGEGDIVWQGISGEFTTSTNPIVHIVGFAVGSYLFTYTEAQVFPFFILEDKNVLKGKVINLSELQYPVRVLVGVPLGNLTTYILFEVALTVVPGTSASPFEQVNLLRQRQSDMIKSDSLVAPQFVISENSSTSLVWVATICYPWDDSKVNAHVFLANCPSTGVRVVWVYE